MALIPFAWMRASAALLQPLRRLSATAWLREADVDLLLQALHPLALAGVWDHSNFRDDLLGRLRRTGQFISGTTYGSRADADWLIERVRTIHLKVSGTAPDGRAYAASDPELLTWVHVAEVYSFLQAHLRYRNPQLSGADQDRYYGEIALIAERLGATRVPRSRAEVAAYLAAIRPELRCDERSLEILRILRGAPAPSALAAPAARLLYSALLLSKVTAPAAESVTPTGRVPLAV